MLRRFSEQNKFYRILPDRNGKNDVEGSLWILQNMTGLQVSSSITLKFSKAYSPQYFYLFGWPILRNKFGEKTLRGRISICGCLTGAELRPEFRRLIQSALRIYWDHLKAKGWADKVLLYVSDEPHALPEITAQMRALCDMIHEVDRNIPIYVSCWSYKNRNS